MSREHSSWINSLLTNLESSGPEAAAAAEYLRWRHTRVSVYAQTTGARWTADRRIEIHPRYAELAADDPYVISLVIHEVRHLQQGQFTALSVYGELEAWHLQFGYLKKATGIYQPDPRRDDLIDELMHVPLNQERSALEQARRLMQAFAGKKYRIDLLPLYPLPAEIRYQVTRKETLPPRWRNV